MIDKIESARQKYKPAHIRLLFIAEAPPEAGSGRFFYFENVVQHDGLFLEMMKVLYDTQALDASLVRKNKAKYLQRFQEDGFYLIDASDRPIVEGANKQGVIRQALPALIARLDELNLVQTPIVLISKPVFEVCEKPLRTRGWNVINTETINFPGSSQQEHFRRKLSGLLRAHGFQVSAEVDRPSLST